MKGLTVARVQTAALRVMTSRWHSVCSRVRTDVLAIIQALLVTDNCSARPAMALAAIMRAAFVVARSALRPW